VNTTYTTLLEPTKCLQDNIKANIKTLTTYLVKESALEAVQAALGKVRDMYNKRV
jgi:hypothetical protein